MIDFELHFEHTTTQIHLGNDCLEPLARELSALSEPRLVVTDSQVARVQQVWLEELGNRVALQRYILPQGEGTKNSAQLLSLLAELGRVGLERGSPLIAFGGGVPGDLAGLAAVLWKRGLPFFQVPTTLLAMVDSCVGGKTAINFGGIKNSVGSFWPARGVYVDPARLATLPGHEWACGYGELLKAAWLSDDDWALQLEEQLPGLFDVNHPDLTGHIERALRFKVGVVEQDPRDLGPRRLLNLGHTFAHAIEAGCENGIEHGQAVLIGMLGAVLVARFCGVNDHDVSQRMVDRLLKVITRLELHFPDGCGEDRDLLALMDGDKKKQDNQLLLVLPERPGRARLVAVEREHVLAGWTELRELAR